MKMFKNLIIVVVLIAVIVISMMNGVLFITHPELTYGTPGMYHIAIIFMLIALGLVYLLTTIEYKFVVSNTKKGNFWSFILNHHSIIVHIFIQFILFLILTRSDVLDPTAAIVIPVVILLTSFLWLRTMIMLYLKSDKYLYYIYVHFVSNLIFIGVTVYLTIQLFLYMNIN